MKKRQLIILLFAMACAAGASALAENSSTVTPNETMNVEQCNTFMDLMEQKLIQYEMEMRKLREENDQLRNELEGEDA